MARYKKLKKKKKKFKISGPMGNEKFELDYGSYYLPDIRYYFEYIFKKHEKVNISSNKNRCK